MHNAHEPDMICSTPPILIACVGNAMAGDDALGPKAASLLRNCRLPRVEVCDLGLSPADLLDLLADRLGLIVIDAVYEPALDPGSLVDLDWLDPQRPQTLHDQEWSSHGLSLAMQLELAERLGTLPPCVRLLGVTLRSARVGMTPDPAMADHLDRLVQTVSHYVRAWTHLDKEAMHA